MGKDMGKYLERSWERRIVSFYKASLVAQMVKNLPVVQETRVRSLGWKDPLEKEMATYSSILAWRIPWREGCSPWGCKESDTTEWVTTRTEIIYFMVEEKQASAEVLNTNI